MRYSVVIPILLVMAGSARAETEETAEAVEAVEAVAAEETVSDEEEAKHEVDRGAAAKELDLTPEVIAKLDGDQLQAVLKERELTRREKMSARTSRMGPEIVAPVAFFVAMIVIVFLPLFFRWRRQQDLHGTLRAMVEKGVEIPLELITPQKPKRNDLRRGVILVALGLGLGIFLAAIPLDADETGLWAVGFIPLLMGIGYLIVWRLQPNDEEAHSPPRE